MAEDTPAEAAPATKEVASSNSVAEATEPVAKTITKQILQSCLTKGLASLCKEKPEQPVRWLAEWLLEHNPNKPVITVPSAKVASATVIPLTSGRLSKVEIESLCKSRTGTMLTPKMALVALDLESGASSSNVLGGGAEGTTHFHQMAQHGVGSVGPCSARGVSAAVNDMLLCTSIKPSSVLWLSATDETVVYLGGKPFALRSLDTATMPSAGGGGAEAEEVLRSEVVSEVGLNGGRIIAVSPRGEGCWLTVAAGAAQTPAEVAVSSAGAGKPAVVHLSLPTAAGGLLSPEAIATLLFSGPAQSAATPVVISSSGQGQPAAMLAVVLSMAKRVKLAGGAMPSDVLPREPLPVVGKWAAERGLLEGVQGVDELVAQLGEGVGAEAKLLADDAIDQVARCHLRHMRTGFLADRAAAEAAANKAGGSEAAKVAAAAAEASLKLYLQAVAIAALLIAPEDKKEGVRAVLAGMA